MKKQWIKNSMIAFFLMLLSGQYFSQTYTKIYDNPADLIKGHAAIEYYGLDAGFKNLSGAMLMTLGANGYYPVTNNIGAEAHVRFPYLRLDNTGSAFMFDGGADYKFMSKTINQDVFVLLSYREEDIIGTDKYVATTKYVVLPGKLKNDYFLRAGLYLKNTSYEFDQVYFDNIITLSHRGIYLGGALSKSYFFKILANESKTKFAAGTILKFYGDILLLPTTVSLSGVEESATFGWRTGLKWYNSPYAKEQNYGVGKGFFGNMYTVLELGQRPLEGFFVTAAVGFILKKF